MKNLLLSSAIVLTCFAAAPARNNKDQLHYPHTPQNIAAITRAYGKNVTLLQQLKAQRASAGPIRKQEKIVQLEFDWLELSSPENGKPLEQRIEYCKMVLDRDIKKGRILNAQAVKILRAHSLKWKNPFTPADRAKLGADKTTFIELQNKIEVNNGEEQLMSAAIKNYIRLKEAR